MAFDLQEQEQIEELKGFWRGWGRWIAALVVIACLGYLGMKGWHLYRAEQAEKASAVFARMETALPGGDLKQLKAISAELRRDYASTSYAPRAALLTARVAFDKDDYKLAGEELSWVIANAKEADVVAVARLRQAAVLLDQKQYDGALKEVSAEHPAAFDGFFLDMKGDILFAKGDAKGAAAAYKSALAKLAPEEPMRDFVQAKIDAIGS
ncbi:YfgM family protein [Crenobacter intestini]|uniref:Ancillary SecYEG translocon subunit n=1 Tax=Crenobacter intestini TaxID=2563443 RepID=A0A4T0UUF9_9NEIS|nr:tetratricopeptide repeat protein [Crenobacter intestini]TIC82306.1 tetratricopeptide repeat protein [Crenobacter intestini]